MYYVELLRVYRALRVCAIILAIAIAVIYIVRVSLGPHFNNFFIENYELTPSAQKTVQVAADGTETTRVEDPAGGLHIVQVRKPGLLDVVVTQTQERYQKHNPGTHSHVRHIEHLAGQSSDTEGIRLEEYTAPDGMHVTHYVNDRHVPADLFLVFAGFLAAIFASIIGASLSKENDGHLELAWTKPVSRQQFAAIMFAIDAGAIAVAGLLAFVSALIVEGIYLGRPVLMGSPDTAGDLAMAILFPLAWYALTQALTASLRRGGGIIGLMWVVSFLCLGLVAVPNTLLQTVLRAINTINPMAYYVTENGHVTSVNGISATYFPANQITDIIALCALIFLAITASLVQWRRLEA